MSIVYIVQNTINGKQYVGQTNDSLKGRIRNHVQSSRHSGGKHIVFWRAIQKHGVENFRWFVLKQCKSREDMNYWESYFIQKLNTMVPTGYNMTTGGRSYNHSDETKRRIGTSSKRHNVSTCRCCCCKAKRGDRHNHKIGCECWYCKGKRGEVLQHSVETRQKIGEGHKGKPGGMLGRVAWNRGLTKETDERIKNSAAKEVETKRRKREDSNEQSQQA